MAITESYSGSASIGTTEYSLPAGSTSLPTKTDKAVVSIFIDFNALTSTEAYQLTIYETVASGSKRSLQTAVIRGAQTDPIYVVPPLLLYTGWDVTLKKLQGTDRTIGWSIREVS